MEKPRRIRRTFSEAQKAAFVAEWLQTKQSAHAFGKACGIGAGNLIRWREQQAKGTQEREAEMAFFPLKVVQESVSKEGPHVVAKIAVGKLCIQVLAGAPKNDVQQLMCALQAVVP